MLVVASVHSIQPKVIPCEFVFDNQGAIGRRAAKWWPTFKNSMKTAGNFDFSPYFTKSEPIFRSDKEFRPLQAGDLYAGHLKRVLATDKLYIPPSTTLRALWGISGYHRVLDYKYLGTLRTSFMRMARNIDAKQPERLKYVLGKPTRKR